MKPVIVISGVNFLEGGPLTIFKDATRTVLEHFNDKYSLILLVHSKSLFIDFKIPDASIYDYPWVKRSWLFRLWFEYVTCYFISKRLKPLLWLALHDITPNVIAKKKAVYCHNPAPFYTVTPFVAKMEPTLLLFSLFYEILYRINIKSNNYVIVQQDWVRKSFNQSFGVTNIIVAHPDIPSLSIMPMASGTPSSTFSFFYPAFPRAFKNFETLMEAADILRQSRKDFEVIVTMTGNENGYAKHIYRKYGDLDNVRFIGIQPRETILDLYNKCDCLVFPSKLETWGLPISEMKCFGKPIIVADKMYAKETVGEYKKVKFFDPEDPSKLSDIMALAIDRNIKFDKTDYKDPDPPFSQNWKQLFTILLDENRERLPNTLNFQPLTNSN